MPRGRWPPGIDLINWYMGFAQRAMVQDRSVYAAFLDVMNLMKPPSSLFHPRVTWRVARADLMLRRRKESTQPRIAEQTARAGQQAGTS